MKPLQFLKSNKGSSLVLIILLMVILLVFGVTAMMSSYTDLKLARKNAEWVKDYYNLSSMGENLVKNIDDCLIKADADAKAFVMSKNYKKLAVEGIPFNVQKEIFKGWNKYDSKVETEANFINRIQKKLYYYLAATNLQKIAEEDNFTINYNFDILHDYTIYSSDTDLPDKNVFSINSIVANSTAMDAQNLEIEIDILYSDYSKAQSESSKYKITKWKQKQKIDNSDIDNIELWDGKVG